MRPLRFRFRNRGYSPRRLPPFHRALRLIARPELRLLPVGNSAAQTSSLEVSRPSSAPNTQRLPFHPTHSPAAASDNRLLLRASRDCLSRYVPPSPFHTTSMACSAARPADVSADSRSWGLMPSRGSPVSSRAPPSPAGPVPHGVSRRTSHRQWGTRRSVVLRCASRELLVESTVSASFRFPFRWGSTPPGLLTCGLPRFPDPGCPESKGAAAPSRVQIVKEQQLVVKEHYGGPSTRKRGMISD